MNKGTIKYLAYLLDDAKKKNKDKAIVFLGAGASVSAGIPLANTIVKDIKEKFKDNPLIQKAILDGKTDYYALMGALTADQRRDLFHYYVTRDEVKLNIANVYLAQLLKLGYVDYIVTVNFDDLILRACTLFNFLPPVYDFSNIKTGTTSKLRTGSVSYLHGQYFGEWLLNNKEELEKVENEVLNLFKRIQSGRTWIVIGYSGKDEIFEKIKSLGSFSSELFWVKKSFSEENDKHVLDFLDTLNNNTHAITDNYADTFFLKLHAELSKLDTKLNHPDIFSKPFTFLKSVMQNVNEINEEDDLNMEVKGYIESSNNRIDKAIDEYENKETLENFKQKIIDALLKENFNEALVNSFEKEIKNNNYDANEELSWYYNNWGVAIYELAKLKQDEKKYLGSIEKYKKATELNPKNEEAFNNWGNAISELAKLKQDKKLYLESFKKYKKATELNSKSVDAFNNWGVAISELAKLKQDKKLYLESFEKYKKTTELNPKNEGAFNNWGSSISELAKLKQDKKLYIESFEKYKKATELNSINDSIYYNWGNAISNLAKLKNDKELYIESFEKYKKATELNPKKDEAFNNWGNAISNLAKLKNDKELYIESFEKYKRATQLNSENDLAFYNWGYAINELAKLTKNEKLFIKGLEKYKIAYTLNNNNPYNLACGYALLKDKENALKYLKESLDKKDISIEHIHEDEDWDFYRDDKDFIELLAKY